MKQFKNKIDLFLPLLFNFYLNFKYHTIIISLIFSIVNIILCGEKLNNYKVYTCIVVFSRPILKVLLPEAAIVKFFYLNFQNFSHYV